MTAPARLNVPLLRATLAHIEAHPEEWDQAWYRCRSGMCFAGHAVTLAGGRWAHPETSADLDAALLLAEPGDPDPLLRVDGTIEAVYRAQRVLGLAVNEANALFDSDNTLDDLRRMVGNLVAGRPIDDGADE